MSTKVSITVRAIADVSHACDASRNMELVVVLSDQSQLRAAAIQLLEHLEADQLQRVLGLWADEEEAA